MGPTFIVQQYNGPPRARETIATLRVNGAETVRLLFLDEEDVAAPIVSDGRLHIELLPGKHTLTARNGDAVRFHGVYDPDDRIVVRVLSN